jgi:sporadic carbohydrate cluster protein (TIGR04323 family)
MLSFRGYIFSRKINGNFIPQRVQNLVIKDFCDRNKVFFKLSATEYKMENSFLMLNSVLKNMKNIDGIVFYSIFMLPDNTLSRKKIYKQILKKKKKFILL